MTLLPGKEGEIEMLGSVERVDPEAVENTRGTRSFEEFFADHYSGLVGGMYLACGDQAEAEDLAQEGMARAFERWDRIQETTSPAGYVYQISFNLLRRRHHLRLDRQSIDTRAPVDPEQIAVNHLTVVNALTQLPLNQRMAVILMEWLDFSEEQAAAFMHVRRPTVRSRLHRAHETLRRHLGGVQDEEP